MNCLTNVDFLVTFVDYTAGHKVLETRNMLLKFSFKFKAKVLHSL